MDMERKKILFIHESLTGGGAEKVFVDLMNRFDREKYRVTVLLLYGGGVHESSLPEDLELIVLYDRRSLLHKLRNHFISTRDSMYRADLTRALSGREFDTIVSYLEGPAMKAHSFIRHLGHRHISWVHINLEVDHWCAFMFRDLAEEARLYGCMDALVFVSAGARDAFFRMLPVNVPAYVIPNVIDRDEITRRSELEDVKTRRFTIVNVGRLESQKRHDRLLRTARILKDRGLEFNLWLLGTGKLEADLKRMCSEMGLDDCVEFLGFQKNPYIYMSAADLFLLTSDTEGWPTVVCEALTLGLPVVSTRVTGSEELLAEGAGVLTTLEPEDIADKVYALATDPETLAGYAARARERGRMFNPDEVLDRIYSLI